MARRPRGNHVSVNFDDWMAITQCYSQYMSIVDAGDWDRWPEMFTEDCVYRLQPRENHERNLPLATLALTSRGMLLDRVYSIKDTLFHDPYYQRHIISSPVLHRAAPDHWECEANYAVFRTKLSDTTIVFNVGRSFDTIVRTDSGLRFARRECIYDSEMIPNSIIYPI
jgi:salicylate 5-hydroxylase small subunit